MKFPILFSVLALLVSCAAQSDNIEPAKVVNDADIDFSKPIWVNHLQYDGVFTIERNALENYQAGYNFYGTEAKAFSPVNDKIPIENGFWFSPKIEKFIGLSYYNSGIRGRVKLNGVDIETAYAGNPNLGKLSENKAISYNADKGLTWDVVSVTFPSDATWKQANNLTATDESSFILSKSGIKAFPDVVKLEKSYGFGATDKELTIKFDAIKNADVIYFKFDRRNYYAIGPDDLGVYESKGFLKYVKGDATSITFKRAEASVFLWNKPEFTMTVSAVKYYTMTNGKKSFLFRNITTSQSTITL
jgi:hypothetical protein